MQRRLLMPRPQWQQKCEQVGFAFHSVGGIYWDESVAYAFSLAQVETLERAMESLHACCLETVDWIVQTGHFEPFHLPDVAIAEIAASWKRRDPTIYGRFDFSWNGLDAPKLLEYNADTPTSLLEASVVQWFWLQEVMPAADQFNSIHEKLIDTWRDAFAGTLKQPQVHFSAMAGHEEDTGNTLYMMDVAHQAGLSVSFLPIEAIGFNSRLHCFVDNADQPITHCFKLYPWEWLWRDDFAPSIADAGIRFVEPAWKLLLSSKAILPLLWQRYPDHPNLLPASFSAPHSGRYARKPIYSREGENVQLINETGELRTDGVYHDEPCIYQALAPLPCFDGRYPVVGGWMVGEEPAGMGIREDASLITRNTSRFIPHFITQETL